MDRGGDRWGGGDRDRYRPPMDRGDDRGGFGDSASVRRPRGMDPAADFGGERMGPPGLGGPGGVDESKTASNSMSSGDSSVLCSNCHVPVCNLASVRLVKVDARDTPLVVELFKFGNSVQLHRPHHDGELIRYKKGKLTCACGTNLGNIQDNVSVPPYREGIEVALLKFQNLAFSLALVPARAFEIPAARKLREHVFPRPAMRKAYEVTPDHVSVRVRAHHCDGICACTSVCKVVNVGVFVQILDASVGSAKLKADLNSPISGSRPTAYALAADAQSSLTPGHVHDHRRYKVPPIPSLFRIVVTTRETKSFFILILEQRICLRFIFVRCKIFTVYLLCLPW